MRFEELSCFAQARKRFLSDDEYVKLKESLIANPRAGDVVPGSGGLRKLRWGDPARSTGKRSGLRIVYYVVESDRLLMIYAYGKDKQTDLTDDQKKAFKALIAEVKKERDQKKAEQQRSTTQRRRRR